MAVRLPFVVAALCATSVGVYADGDGLVATVAGKMEVSHQGMPSQGTPPPGMQSGEFPEPPCASCIALARSAFVLA